MFSYQHAYHAGCFADITKHLVLTRILHYMTQKDKPFLYLDTHAGRGLYDLEASQALKTQEKRFGIDLFWQSEALKNNKLCQPYVESIQRINTNHSCRFYPGSPSIAQYLLRPIDRLICCEYHPHELTFLQENFKHEKRMQIKAEDGLIQLKAALPPSERRGLIFIDPSFEIKTEYQTIPDAIHTAFKRFATGIYCLWYPIVDRLLHQKCLKKLSNIDAPHLCIKFSQKNTLSRMTACGLWIINPPYTLSEEINALSPIWDTLNLNMELST